LARTFLLVVDPTGVELRSGDGETLATAGVESVERRVDDLSWRLAQARRGGSSAEVAYRLRLLGEASLACSRLLLVLSGDCLANGTQSRSCALHG
jgi:hypothetical protein